MKKRDRQIGIYIYRKWKKQRENEREKLTKNEKE